MPHTLCTLEDHRVAHDASVRPTRAIPSTRYCYSKVEGGHLKFAIIDLAADGQEEWAEQGVGEFRWHPFSPCDQERRMIQAWHAAGNSPAGWPRLTLQNDRSAQ